jgi:hypothetical protein
VTAQRQPAFRKTHPAEELPERPPRTATPSPSLPPSAAAPVANEQSEGLSLTHNTRIRPSVKARLRRGVDKLRYETGDRTISEASITDKALEEYLDKHGL